MTTPATATTRTGPPNWRRRVNSEHVEVLRERLRDYAEGLAAPVALHAEDVAELTALIRAAIASLSAPQPPAEAQPAPSAPVGVEWLVAKWRDRREKAIAHKNRCEPGTETPVLADWVREGLLKEAQAYGIASAELEAALAQQPASDGGFTAADMMDARQEGRKEAQQGGE